jgi:hypothetical protein
MVHIDGRLIGHFRVEHDRINIELDQTLHHRSRHFDSVAAPAMLGCGEYIPDCCHSMRRINHVRPRHGHQFIIVEYSKGYALLDPIPGCCGSTDPL